VSIAAVMGRSAGYTVERPVSESITALLATAERGDRAAADAVFSLLYEELHRMARRELARRAGVTLSATELLHDAYLNISQREGVTFPDRNRYMGYACRVMRRLIIDYARTRQAQKRGGHFEITSLSADVAGPATDAGELTRISDALDELGTVDERLVKVVDLKFFCGFSFIEIANMLGVNERTVQRDWEKARLFLFRRLKRTL
jgi:RNA polymerase sigma factor (TIGR02999 family)